ncbi:hypothetical protein ACFQ2T_05085 [Methylophilus flavus]|uniref:Uncharacterized protein n=1 Tax=Methylophilus flavus TaxID=640084 RepID=A0ABW3PA39_9PROT
MNIDVAALGFTQEELQERVIDRICQTLLSSMAYDDENDSEWPIESKFQNAIKKHVEAKVQETINKLAEKHVLPNVANYIETMTLTKTNQWGEKVGTGKTFIEYLTDQAQEYMNEMVDYQGKTKSQSGSYSFNGTQTRLTHLVNNHLHYSIETAMKEALSIANSSIATGIQETVKVKLSDISKALKVSVTTK